MKTERLKRLARLASGAAVMAMGPVAACTPSDTTSAPTDGHRPVINAPATGSAEIPTGAGDLAEAGLAYQPSVNGAPPVMVLPVDAGTDDDAGDAGSHRRHWPPHVNAAPPGAQQP